jgi:2-oxoglutarate dehydrogenase complex dehydrogenase (E1) component-like enzyme
MPEVVLTSSAGQVYYALVQERDSRGIKDIAISRVEQLSPFPYDLVCHFTHCGKSSIADPCPRS